MSVCPPDRFPRDRPIHRTLVFRRRTRGYAGNGEKRSSRVSPANGNRSDVRFSVVRNAHERTVRFSVAFGVQRKRTVDEVRTVPGRRYASRVREGNRKP